ncbi:MAG: Hpt domain-containing protein [Deltaproteobacteria bacterium]|nr:Hpt domain-containing protein [Deltaproteobacteria bacterium]MBW2120462.1 Hpt domain-containing protein [Deltaproteobacteria bacterium]
MDKDLASPKGFFSQNSVAEEVLELRSLYLEYLRGEVDTLRSLVARRDLEGIRELGHRLKGSGGSYGFHGISDLGEAIQCLPDSAEWEKVEVLFHRLEEMYEDIAA